MNIEEFRAKLESEISELDNELTIVKCEVLKNNGVTLYGLTLKRDDSNISPTFYLERSLEEYLLGKDIRSIAEGILREEEENRFDGEFQASYIEDFEFIKDKLYLKVINTKMNEKLLEDVPSKRFLDLSFVVYIDVSDVCHMRASILVKNQYMKLWDKDINDIFDSAIANTKQKKHVIRDISEYFEKLPGMESDKLYVLTNEEGMFGAVGFTQDDLLDEFIMEKYDGVYIIPSSIHETILIPDRGENCYDELNSIIKCVNYESLKREEVLADHAYYYSCQDGYSIV